MVQSMHPDAQLTSDAHMLPIEGSDCHQQEALLKSIWQLLRCGKMDIAQDQAKRHRLFWLAASLLGQSNPYYDYASSVDANNMNSENASMGAAINNDGGSGNVVKKGNTRRPLWLLTCWKYAQRLDANPANWGALQPSSSSSGSGYNNINGSYSSGQYPHTHGTNPAHHTASGVLEMTIYASLCSHLPVLQKSPLLSTWSDRLWSGSNPYRCHFTIPCTH